LIAPEAGARSGGAKKQFVPPACRLGVKASKSPGFPASRSGELSLNLLIEGQVERLVPDKAIRHDDEGPAGEPLCKPPWIAGIAAERLWRDGPLNNLFDWQLQRSIWPREGAFLFRPGQDASSFVHDRFSNRPGMPGLSEPIANQLAAFLSFLGALGLKGLAVPGGEARLFRPGPAHELLGADLPLSGQKLILERRLPREKEMAEKGRAAFEFLRKSAHADAGLLDLKDGAGAVQIVESGPFIPELSYRWRDIGGGRGLH